MGRVCNSLLQRFGKDPREVVAKKKHGGEVELAEGCSDKRKYVQRRGGLSVLTQFMVAGSRKRGQGKREGEETKRNMAGKQEGDPGKPTAAELGICPFRAFQQQRGREDALRAGLKGTD